MFKTAHFKIHNPSRHKQALLRYALSHYHLTLKNVLEAALADPELQARVTVVGKNGKAERKRCVFGRGWTRCGGIRSAGGNETDSPF
jgi:hypothetical protein